jgi:hypothetical protein
MGPRGVDGENKEAAGRGSYDENLQAGNEIP